MEDKKTFITKEGLAALKKELEYLKTVKRREVAERIQEAKELGDLSENAEYTEAKEEQAFMEGKIQELSVLLKNVTVIKKVKGPTDRVMVGSTLTISTDGRDFSYTIVGPKEANPLQGKISNESPLGCAFLDRKVGESVTVPTPRGKNTYVIKAIS